MKADYEAVVKNLPDLLNTAKLLSLKYGDAWLWSIVPFSHKVRFFKYQNPSSVSDTFLDLTDGMIAWKGEIVPFTKAAIRREKRREFTGDR